MSKDSIMFENESIDFSDEESISESNGNERRSWKAIYAATAISAVSFHIGYAIGFSSPAARDMENDDSISMSADEISWFNTLLSIAALVGGIASVPAAQFLGRRTMVMVVLLMFAVGWVMIFIGQSMAVLFVGRILTGLAFGTSNTVVPVYCGEVSPPSLRGSLGTLYNLFLAVGIPVSFAFGTFFTWRTLAQIAFIFVIISGVITVTLPESHYWLIKNRHYKRARISLRYFDYTDEVEITKEIESIKKCVESDQNNNEKLSWREVRKPQFYKPIVIVVALNLFQQFSGVNGVFYNIHYIFKAANFHNEDYASIAVGMVQVLAIMLSLILIERTGRRKLMMLSSMGSCISLLTLGISLSMISSFGKPDDNTLEVVQNDSTGNDSMQTEAMDIGDNKALNVMTWVSLASSISFIIFFALGLGPIAFVAVSEVIPLSYREFGSGMASFSNGLSSVIVIKSFKNLVDLMQLHGVFWTYSVFCFICFCYVYYYLPETKGKTLLEIENIFSGLLSEDEESNASLQDSSKLFQEESNVCSKSQTSR